MTKRLLWELVREPGCREEKIVSHQRISRRGWRRQTVRNAKRAGALYGGKLPRFQRLKTLRFGPRNVERRFEGKNERGSTWER
jgi:hypothetical protein